jgi:hypothetical protein
MMGKTRSSCHSHVAIRGGKHGTALQAALRQGHSAVGKLLLDKGADPNVQGECIIHREILPLTCLYKVASSELLFKQPQAREILIL